MASAINNYSMLNNGASNYLYDRLNGKDVTLNSATTITNDSGDKVKVTLSPEAQQTLKRLDNITKDLRSIEKQFGEVDFSSSDKTSIQNIAKKLDKLHGYNIAQTSESYLFLGKENRALADSQFSEINNILKQDNLSTDDTIKLDSLVIELDNKLTTGEKYALQSLQGLDDNQLKEVTRLFIDLSKATQGLEDNKVSDVNMKKASDISLKIDTFLKENGKLTATKRLNSNEEQEANKLLNSLDNIIKKVSRSGVSAKLREITSQTSLSFLQIIMGNKNKTEVPIFSLNQPISTLPSSPTSKQMIEAQRIINAYNARQT